MQTHMRTVQRSYFLILGLKYRTTSSEYISLRKEVWSGLQEGVLQGREAFGNILQVKGKPWKLKGYQKSLSLLNVEVIYK